METSGAQKCRRGRGRRRREPAEVALGGRQVLVQTGLSAAELGWLVWSREVEPGGLFEAAQFWFGAPMINCMGLAERREGKSWRPEEGTRKQ